MKDEHKSAVEKAEKMWLNHTNQRFDDITNGTKGAIKGMYQLTAIKDFKSALKREIEKRIGELERHLESCPEMLQTIIPQIEECKRFLSLLETVKP